MPLERALWRSDHKDRSTAMDAIANMKKVQLSSLTCHRVLGHSITRMLLTRPS